MAKTLFCTLIVAICCTTALATPVGTAFTYQGQLKSGGTPYTGTADMQFTLYDAATLGNVVAGPIASGNVQVANGLFTTTLDFGANAFHGDACWLQLAVITPAGGGPYVTLSPRQAVRPTPYALKVPGIDGYSLDAVDGSPIDALFVNNDGYVGIGTGTPQDRLHVLGAGIFDFGASGRLTAGTPAGAGPGLIALAPNGHRRDIAFRNGDIAIGASMWGDVSAVALVIRENLNVGIGTETPLSRLTVAGTIESTDGGFKFPDGSVQTKAATGAGGLTLPYSGNANSSSPGFEVSNSGVGYAIRGTTQGNAAVVGETSSSNAGHAGVWGKSTGTGPGVAGTAFGINNDGVYGGGTGTGAGVRGVSGAAGKGVYGEATATSGVNYGVYGKTSSPAGWAAYFDGRAYFSGNVGIGTTTPQNRLDVDGGNIQVRGPQGFDAPGEEATIWLGDGNHYIKGIHGQGIKIGTWTGEKVATERSDLLIQGPDNFASAGQAASLFLGDTAHYIKAVREFGVTIGTWPVGGVIHVREPYGWVGIGTDAPEANLHVAGRTRTAVLEITGGSDLAEPFVVNGTHPGQDPPSDLNAGSDTLTCVAPGMVVVIDPEHPGQLKLATQAYDRKVAGIISGANGLKPGMVMKAAGDKNADGNHPVALTGRVWCWCNAASASIEPGDRLTTSATPGHAMKVTDRDRADGAVLGKAMTSLERETGLVLVLVTLQ